MMMIKAGPFYSSVFAALMCHNNKKARNLHVVQ
jgi:hypothetical protein